MSCQRGSCRMGQMGKWVVGKERGSVGTIYAGVGVISVVSKIVIVIQVSVIRVKARVVRGVVVAMAEIGVEKETSLGSASASALASASGLA